MIMVTGNGSNGKMKRNFNNILFMNKNYLFAAAVMACVCTSCSQDESLNVLGEGSLVFTGEMESVGSRTSLSEDDKVLWVENDEVSIFKGTNTNRRYKVVGLENGKATFDFVSYSTPAEVVKFSGNYSVYPYSDGNAIDANGTISATVGAEYTYTDKASSISSALMVAKSEGTNFSYKNAQGILRLRLNAEMPEDFLKITSITLTSASQNLSGVAEMSWEGTETPVAVIKDGENVTKSLTINIPEGLVLPAKQDNDYEDVYVPVVPVTFAAGDVEMVFTFEDGSTLTSRKNKSEFSIVRKEITGMKYTIGTDGFTGEIEEDPDMYFYVGSNEELANIDGESGIAMLSGDLSYSDDFTFEGALESTGELSLDMGKVNSGTPSDYGFIAKGSDSKVTIDNMNLDSEGGGIGATDGAQLTFNGGSVAVNTTSTSGRYNFYVVGEGTVVTVNGGGFSFSKALNQKRAYIYAGSGATVYVKGGTFGKASAREGYTDGILGDGKVVISGGTFGFDPTKWVAEGCFVVKNDGLYIVGEPASSVDEFKDALSSQAAVSLAEAIDNGNSYFEVRNNDIIKNMEEKELKAGGNGTSNYAFHLYGSNVEVNNANINGAGFAVMEGSSVTVNSGTIAASPGKSGRNMFYVTGSSSVTVNEGTYTFDRTSCYFVYVDAGSTCYIKGGHFEKPLANDTSKDSFVNTGSEGTVIITGGTFNVDPTAWLADGYKAVKEGKIWTVSAE